MIEAVLIMLIVLGVLALLFKLVRDPEPPPPATLEAGRSHMRVSRGDSGH